MKNIESYFFERTKGVISGQFSHICTILSENWPRHLPCCLWRGIPKLFPFSLLAYISEESFSTRPTSQSEHDLSPDTFNENTAWCCLLGSQCDWPITAVWDRSCGFWCTLMDLTGTLATPCACELFPFCQLPLKVLKCPQKPHAQSTPFRFVGLQIPVCLVPEAASESNQSHCSAISDWEFPSYFWANVCACIYVFKKKTNPTTFWFCALSTFEGNMGPCNMEVYNLLS